MTHKTIRMINRTFIESYKGVFYVGYGKELLDCLVSLKYRWRNGKKAYNRMVVDHLDENPNKYCLLVDSKNKQIGYSTRHLLRKNDVEICEFIDVVSPEVKDDTGNDICPLCGASGTMTFTSFYCANKECENYWKS